jgi:hypothetical protein
MAKSEMEAFQIPSLNITNFLLKNLTDTFYLITNLEYRVLDFWHILNTADSFKMIRYLRSSIR